MSLSFVSKSIQTGRDDGGFDEKPVESSGNDSGGKSSTSFQKPLFEQLRDNQEQEEAERAEFQRSIMRGTLALDDEDCAHLDAVQKQRMEKEATRHRQTEADLAAFRAAQADRLEKKVVVDDSLEEGKSKAKAPPPSEKKRDGAAALPAPKIIVKKRRLRKPDSSEVSKDDAVERGDKKGTDDSAKDSAAGTAEKEKANAPLGGLLSGYGSSSDED